MTRIRRSAACAAIACVGVAGSAWPGGARGQAPASALQPLPADAVAVQGLRRVVRFYVPGRVAPAPALVMVLHGGGGDGERFRHFTQGAFERQADAHGFVIAYPDALGGQWHDCRRGAEYAPALAGVDDVALVEAVVRRAAQVAGRALESVFVVGYSNGGHMVFRLASERPQAFTAFATIGASLPIGEEWGCPPLSAVPILLVHGTDDPINPWSGGNVRAPGGLRLGRVLPAEETADTFVRLAGGTNPVVRLHPGSGRAAVEMRAWTNGGEIEVRQVIVRGGGHTLPLPVHRFPEAIVGSVPGDLDGAEEIWRFFDRARGRMPGPPGAANVHVVP